MASSFTVQTDFITVHKAERKRGVHNQTTRTKTKKKKGEHAHERKEKNQRRKKTREWRHKMSLTTSLGFRQSYIPVRTSRIYEVRLNYRALI